MEKTEQLKSILTDLDNGELTKHQAHDLICVLFSVSNSWEGYCSNETLKNKRCDKMCNKAQCGY